MLCGLKGISYQERLGNFVLFSLERQRSWGYLIEVHKIMLFNYRLDSQNNFSKVGTVNNWHP